MTEADLRETAAAFRTHLLSTLQLFASPARQRKYKDTVPFVDVTSEMVCCWADDLYHPDSPAHAIAFSPAERASLAGFDAVLRRWSAAIPVGDLEAFIASSAGVELARAAADALRSMGVVANAEPHCLPT
jgi:hypothetical protein